MGDESQLYDTIESDFERHIKELCFNKQKLNAQIDILREQEERTLRIMRSRE